MGKKNCNKDAIKKERERNTLKEALNKGAKSTQEDTRRICSSLLVSTIKTIEHPDFLLTNSQERICYGVEHLRVDHQIRIQHGTIGAASTQFKSDAEKVRQKYKDNISNNIIDALDELNRGIEGQLNRTFNATYSDILLSFEHSLEKHFDKIENYYENCKDIIPLEYNYKSVLLIEVVADFSRLFICSYRKAKRNTSGLMPMFDDVIDLLSKEELKRIDYYVLILRNYIKDDVQVVAFDNYDLKKSLDRNNIKPTRYCSYEKYLVYENNKSLDLVIEKSFQEGEILKTPYCINYKQCNDIRFMPAIYSAAKDAMELRDMHKDYVTDYCTLLFIEVYGPNVKCWRKIKGTDLYWADIRYDKRVFSRRMRKFDERYPMQNDT